nr:hypothetical protein [Aureimonas sp. AU22]
MPGRGADRVACLAALALLMASGVALVGALRAEPWLRYALRIETAAAPLNLPSGVRNRLSARLAEQDVTSCDWDLPESRVTVAMELLRRSREDAPDSPNRSDAEGAAGKAVHEAISCNAADANLWYLLALLEQRSGTDWGRVQELLLLSAALAPHETDLLTKRARLVSWQLGRGSVALPLDLEADLRRAIASARIEDAAAILASLRKGGRQALADDLVAGLSDERLRALETGTSWRRSTFGRPERYRTYEYRPFGEPAR